MAIHQEVKKSGKETISSIDDAPTDSFRAKDPIIDLGRGVTFLDILGGFSTDDNMAPQTLEQLKKKLGSDLPRVNYFINRISPFMNPGPLHNMLAGGTAAMLRQNINIMGRFFGQSPVNIPHERYLVTHPTLEGCMEDYEYIQANPNEYFSDHALSVIVKGIGPFLGKNISCQKLANGKWKITSSGKYTVNEVVKHTKNLFLFGNSFGSNFIPMTENAMRFLLCSVGYQSSEIQSIMGSVRALGLSNVSPFVIQEEPRYTSVFIEGMNDAVAHVMNPFKTIPTQEEIKKQVTPELQDKLKLALLSHARLMEEAFSDSESYVPSTIPNTNPDALENLPVMIFRRVSPNRLLILATVHTHKEKWLGGMNNKDADADRAGHHFMYYLRQGYPLSLLPELCRRVVCNSLRYPSLSPWQKQEFVVTDLLQNIVADYSVQLSHTDRPNPLSHTLDTMIDRGIRSMQNPNVTSALNS